jgi:hypothetical protein
MESLVDIFFFIPLPYAGFILHNSAVERDIPSPLAGEG